MNPISYTRLHYPSSIVQHVVWLYLRFNLSLRDVEDLLAERGLDISYETVRRWVARFGPAYARRLRAMRLRPCDTWHLDEVFVSIGGRMMYLWRAVDAEGEVLDVLVQPRPDKRAALTLMRRLLRKQGFAPDAIVTDKLRSYSAALREIGMADRHVTGGRLNNRAENSHQPTRRQERSWIGIQGPGSTQRFLSTHAAVYNTFNVQCHLISRRTLRPLRGEAFAQWQAAAEAA
ncbi:putative IS6 family transposase [alpha proteobacterium BAL199]|jgi:putative transposase|nr:putative IS6 family transposase [alpha proteobacterium BAL199]